jgi:hypothetical protein
MNFKETVAEGQGELKCKIYPGDIRSYRLDMELELHSYLGSCVQLYSLAEIPQLPPAPPAFGPIYVGAIGQPW